jgi:hypothetical protein
MSDNPESFAAVSALIALVSDTKSCAKRLAELRATIDAAEKAQAQLDADRAAHARTMAADEERAKSVREREAKLILGERDLRVGQEALAAARRALAPRPGFDPNLGCGTMGPGGIVRDEYRS